MMIMIMMITIIIIIIIIIINNSRFVGLVHRVQKLCVTKHQ